MQNPLRLSLQNSVEEFYLVAQQDRTHSTIPLKCQYFPQQVYAAAASFLPFWFMFSIQYFSCLFIHVLYLLEESSTAVSSPIPGQQQKELETVPPLKRKRGLPPKASKDTTSASKKSNSSSIHSEGDILSILILTYCNT